MMENNYHEKGFEQKSNLFFQPNFKYLNYLLKICFNFGKYAWLFQTFSSSVSTGITGFQADNEDKMATCVIYNGGLTTNYL